MLPRLNALIGIPNPNLPRGLGVAFAIGRARRLGVPSAWPADAIAVCSFGDASANHSTAQGAINAACYTAHSGLPVPLLFVCEDNGRGISVPTPTGWIEATFAGRPALRYAQVDGTDPVGVHTVTADLADHVRATGRPALLHLRTVRYMGHAGTDVESGYRSIAASVPIISSTRSWRVLGRSSRPARTLPPTSSTNTSRPGSRCARWPSILPASRRCSPRRRSSDRSRSAAPKPSRRRATRSARCRAAQRGIRRERCPRPKAR